MKTKIIRIGNSQGVRIPKVLLEQVGLVDDVEVEAQGDRLILRPAHAPRQGWDSQFELMAEQGDDRLLDEITPTDWESGEWEW